MTTTSQELPHAVTRARPERVLTHPLWLVALAVLILNDHLFKGAGILSPELTGKLSDFAGLIVAPALLATLVRATSRRALLAVHLAIGAVFAAINVSPAFARAFEDLMALGPFPWHITVDPSDLVSLPTLLVSWHLLRTTAARPRPVRRPLSGFLLALGLVASAATEPPPPDFAAGTISADLVIGAASNDTLILRIRPLRDTVRVDCATAVKNPTAALSRDLFGPAAAWRVDPEQITVVSATGSVAARGECSAFLVDGTLHRGRIDGTASSSGEPIPMALLFWTARDFPIATVPASTDEAPSDRLLLIGRTNDGPRWEPHAALFLAPPDIASNPRPGCEPAPEGGFVDWQLPVPIGSRTVEAITSTPDGCHRIALAGANPWYLCTGTETLPFVSGDRVQVSTLASGETFHPIDGLLLLGNGEAEGKRVALARGADLAPFGGDWNAGDLPECDGSVGPCGSLVFPQELTIDRPNGQMQIVAGDAVEMPNGLLVLHRAERIPVGDSACFPASADSDLVFESVYLAPPPGAANAIPSHPSDAE